MTSRVETRPRYITTMRMATADEKRVLPCDLLHALQESAQGVFEHIGMLEAHDFFSDEAAAIH